MMFKLTVATVAVAALMAVPATALAANGSDNYKQLMKDDRYPWTQDVRQWDGSGKFTTKRQAPVRKAKKKKRVSSPAKIVGKAAKSSLVTVKTAAGISITVASSVANRFTGFISDLVAKGIHPTRIHCYAKGGHVRNSNHYWGGACDFNGSASKWSPMTRGKVSHLAAKWGLRDGCSFRIRGGRPDCGHIDVPLNVAGKYRHRGYRVARR